LLYGNIRIRDAYGSAIYGDLLQATATNGGLVSLDATNKTTPTKSTAYATTAAENYVLSVAAPSAAPLTTVVTVSYAGSVIGTKSFTFTGNVAKVTLSSAANGKLNTATTNTATITFADAAGNAVYMVGNTPSSGLVADSTGYNNIVSSVSMTTPPTDSSTTGKVSFTCGGAAGKAAIAVTYINNDGTSVKSNSLPVTCSGKAVSYTASYDKSTYNLGDIATLVITFKDSLGNLANDSDAVATAKAAITTAGLGATPVSGPAIGDLPTNGVIKYTYTVGDTNSTTGTFTNSIDFSTVDTNSGGVQGAVTAKLVVASSGTTLNDVLKGIVSLIASINKQIAALAKLVTKKK